ncbi:protein phosphatase 2C domain-containing protein [Streptomyces sp. NPDC048172]|uniref:protein phosphatase 2C domain-containing protein n=1 Tax=Streptomyces sp. NPDC048172 TaxID=3365505 RepID=UPI003717522D
MPEPSEVPGIREAPAPPDVPESPDVPAPPDVPGPPAMPEAPDVPEAPVMPEAPSVPGPPSVPAPSVPGPGTEPAREPGPEPRPEALPDAPDVPPPPELPEAPELPDPPSMPEAQAGFGPAPSMTGTVPLATVSPAREPDDAVAPATLPMADPAALGELVPDTALDGAHYGTLTLRAVSSRGEAAREAGALRGDALLTARFGSGGSTLLLVAVASGGHRAAREVCHSIGGAVGRSHARLAEDIHAGRRGALKSGLNRLTDRAYGKLRAQAAALGLDPEAHSADLRCLLLPADPRCGTRVFFGIGDGGLFRLRDGAWQDIEPRVEEAEQEDDDEDELSQGSRPTMKLGTTRLDDPAARAAAARDGFHEQPPEEPRAEPFRFRASEARQDDVLLLCGPGMAEPVREERAFAELLRERWAEGAPGLSGFLSDVQHRAAEGYGGDRTAVAVWES